MTTLYSSDDNNLSLPVLSELPTGIQDIETRGREKEAYGINEDGEVFTFHYCDQCKGWIPGYYHAVQHNSLGRLSGRRGTSYHCCRCGAQISFIGLIA